MRSQNNLSIYISLILRYGVWSSMFIVAVGAILYLFQFGHDWVDYSTYSPNQFRWLSFFEMLRGISNAQGLSIIQFGLFVLISTPILRLLMAIYSFWCEKIYLYVGIGLIVLMVIVGSFFLGFTH